MIDLGMRDFETRAVKEELIAMDLDEDDMMDADDTPTESRQANPSNIQQIVPTDNDGDDNWDANIDPGYMKLLDSCREDGVSYLGDNPLRCIRYEVDCGSYDKRGFKPITNMQRSSKEVRNNTRRVKKKKKVESKQPRVQPSGKKKTEREAGIGLRRRESLAAKKSVEGNKENNSDGEMVLNENYRSYLKWLVENSKSSSTNSQKEIQVKCEPDTVSLSDGDIIAVGDRPFLDDEDSPFVPSKNYKVVDLEEENDNVSVQSSSAFRKEILDVLKKPYNEEEFLNLEREASVHRNLIKWTQLLDGGEFDMRTDDPTPSYLDQYPDFKRMFFDSLHKKDGYRALNLLRGFIFYLEKVARVDAFKPWLDPECVNITFSGQKRYGLPSTIETEFRVSSLSMELN